MKFHIAPFYLLLKLFWVYLPLIFTPPYASAGVLLMSSIAP